MVLWKLWQLIVLIKLVNCDIQQLKAADPNYGVTWMFMPDDQGNPHVVDLTEPSSTTYTSWLGDVEDVVTFYYYRQSTIDSPSSFLFVNDPDTPLGLSQSYDPTLPTKFIIHGWKNSVYSPVCQNIKNRYLEREDLNVIVVDWAPLASDTLYYWSASATRDVGGHVGGLIDRMVEERGTDLNNVHIIGHSLGAHTSGFAGSSIKKGKVARVTGLDPARPGFGDEEPDKLLDPTDAQFVDVIHTCAGGLGHEKHLGHVDFWPNGGHETQPGCGFLIDLVGACSHGRSYEYYAESITQPTAFEAYPCDSESEFHDGKCRTDPTPMGDATPSTARGNLFLETNDEPEYGKGFS